MHEGGGGAGGGSIMNFLRTFFSDSAQTFRRRTLLCFRKFPMWKILCIKRVYHDFLLNSFYFTLPKSFVEELL